MVRKSALKKVRFDPSESFIPERPASPSSVPPGSPKPEPSTLPSTVPPPTPSESPSEHSVRLFLVALIDFYSNNHKHPKLHNPLWNKTEKAHQKCNQNHLRQHQHLPHRHPHRHPRHQHHNHRRKKINEDGFQSIRPMLFVTKAGMAKTYPPLNLSVQMLKMTYNKVLLHRMLRHSSVSAVNSTYLFVY